MYDALRDVEDDANFVIYTRKFLTAQTVNFRRRFGHVLTSGFQFSQKPVTSITTKFLVWPLGLIFADFLPLGPLGLFRKKIPLDVLRLNFPVGFILAKFSRWAPCVYFC